MQAVTDLVAAPFRFATSKTGVAVVSVATTGYLVGKLLQARLRMIGKDEQLVMETATELLVITGPRVIMMPLVLKNSEKKKALTLLKTEYCIVKNSLTGISKCEVGPKMVFLQPYDEVVGGGARQMITLLRNEFVRFKDQTTGKIRVEKGEQGAVMPSPTEVYVDAGGKRTAVDLNASEWCKTENKETGRVMVHKGPQLVFLDSYDEFVSKPAKQKALDLKVYQWVRVQDHETGKTRVERGEKLLFPGAYEEFQLPVQNAVEIDDQTAVLVRNKRSGQQHLEKKLQLFVPKDDEEIVEVRPLVKLADYEACIVRGKDGKDQFFFGKHPDQRSFFVPPFSELVQLCWSRGRRREFRDLLVTKLDLRPMFMSFEFNCRTADNVELVLEGTLFWEIADPVEMLKYTNDTTGDICNHARSQFIERVSRVSLQQFMSDFNVIAAEAHRHDDTFYKQRGCKIHSLEVTGYHCAESKTAEVLGQIIQETTNRMNRLQKQESESEVQLSKIKGQIAEEEARKSLLAIQTENSNARMAMEGLGEAVKITEFLGKLQNHQLATETCITMWNVLRKREALAEVSQGDARLFFTPKDVNLSIESHDHGSVAGA
ncbi:unnamed protein product [Amoebophrya sp. A120]|nr:unnamed protein product [Amoebophrya sp. A120]|eukprot:GSA120T00002378001.1